LTLRLEGKESMIRRHERQAVLTGLLILSFCGVAVQSCTTAPEALAWSTESPRSGVPWALEISNDGRRIQRSDGSDWFWLADTAWSLFARLDRGDVDYYMARRAQGGFTVIQAVVLMGYNHLWNEPNVYGDRPFINDDPTRPDTRGRSNFWTHADYIVDSAAEHGLYIAILPMWGYYVNGQFDTEIRFTRASAVEYATWIARRYRNRPNVIWVNGGDVDGGKGIATFKAIGAAIDGASPHQLQTFHPLGGRRSSIWFHTEDWLDFNMFQSGHGRRDNRNDALVYADWSRIPPKPTLDGESCYERHPIGWDYSNPSFDEDDVRQAAYWSVFAGACGHTYGHVNVWCFNVPGQMPPQRFEVVMDHSLNWRDELNSAGALQVGFMRRLMESRPAAGRVPYQEMLVEQLHGAERLMATRGDGYALVYTSRGNPIRVDLESLSWREQVYWWFNPRDGAVIRVAEKVGDGEHVFDPPGDVGRGNDWVLVIDDARKEYTPPGT
jgi:hypothetical protein